MSEKQYEILDNGGTSFIATVMPSSSQVKIQKMEYDSENDEQRVGNTVLNMEYEGIFIGDNDLECNAYAEKGKMPGNSILIKESDGKYISVGWNICSFKTIDNESIVSYYSGVGNSWVPYPYAVGEKYVYFMLEGRAMSRNLLDINRDCYEQFYAMKEQPSQPFHDMQVIVERVF